MSTANDFIRSRPALALRLAGFVLFLIAFALPAVSVGRGGDMKFYGYECAKIASNGLLELVKAPTAPGSEYGLNHGETLLLVLSGLINPLVVAQLLSFTQKQRVLSLVLSGITALCMVATWTLFARIHIFPLIGHVLWILGAGLVMAANVVKAANERGTL